MNRSIIHKNRLNTDKDAWERDFYVTCRRIFQFHMVYPDLVDRKAFQSLLDGRHFVFSFQDYIDLCRSVFSLPVYRMCATSPQINARLSPL